MSALRVLLLCLAAAFMCATLRTAHPQLAAVVALAAGVAAISLSIGDIGEVVRTLRELENLGQTGDASGVDIIKMTGLALLAEFAADICADAGEAALSRRIEVAARLAIAAAALPLALELLKGISALS